MSYKLGSLFDGSGGFPLAGSLCGIEPRWASEVEPYPIAVTRERFPNMKHLGDISKINGAEIEPVDIITFGSPCQDLSVAGKRAGLKHEANGDEETTRSGLFMEAVRIIKEMREATGGQYPRFALWENVPGAFSSNKGEDFRVVCEELIKIAELAAVMPPVPKAGWPYADSYVGDGWSLAYRVFDAQYWGVPQRRRRIHLVLDLRGERAREVLFEREGVRGYFAEGRTPWKGITAHAEGSTGAADSEGKCYGLVSKGNGEAWLIDEKHMALSCGGGQAGQGFPCTMVPCTLKIRSGCEGGGKGALIQTDKSATLSTLNDQYLFQPVIDGNILDDQGGSQISVRTDGKSPTLRAEMHGNVPCVLEAAGFKSGNGAKAAGIGYDVETSPTLSAAPSGTNQAPTVVYGFARQSIDEYKASDTLSTINRRDYKAATDLVCEVVEVEEATPIVFDKEVYNSGENAAGGHYIAEGGPSPSLRSTGHPPGVCTTAGVDCRNATEYPEMTGALQSACNHNMNSNSVVRIHYIVRRLIPTECARLQGFADWWSYIEPKETLTDAEYEFWCKVNLEYAMMQGTVRPDGNGGYEIWREVKPDKKKGEDFNPYWENTGKPYTHKTRQQMLAWYNKLKTDSSEYKMWGNGIALPPALYCLQGIYYALAADAPQTAEEAAEPVAEVWEDESTAATDTPEEAQQDSVAFSPAPVVTFDETEADGPEPTAEEPHTAEEAADLVAEVLELVFPHFRHFEDEAPPAPLNAVDQLRKLASERQALARLHPDSDRFQSDVRALEYAVSVLEAVGL